MHDVRLQRNEDGLHGGTNCPGANRDPDPGMVHLISKFHALLTLFRTCHR